MFGMIPFGVMMSAKAEPAAPFYLDLSDNDGGWTEESMGVWLAPDTSGTRAVDSVHTMPGDGRLILPLESLPRNGSAPVSLDRNATKKDYHANDFSCHVNRVSGIYARTDLGVDAYVSGSVVAAPGDIYSLHRSGNTVTLEHSQNGGASWDVLYTYTTTTTAPLYAHFQSFAGSDGRYFSPTGVGFL